MAKYLVTGGAGFIGSHLVDSLVELGNEVVIIDNLSAGIKGNINPKAIFYNIDILDPKISEIFNKVRPDAVFHFAAQVDVRKSIINPTESAKINILGSLNVLENCKKFGVKKIIFASSGGAIYGDTAVIPTPEDYLPMPVSPYGVEKLAVEQYLDYYKREHSLDYLALRFSNVYGPRQNSNGEAGVVAIFCAKFLAGAQPIINGNGKQTRDFIFVGDLVDAIILGVQKNITGVFNIGTGIETSINDMFDKLNKLFGSENKSVYVHNVIGEQKRSCLDCNKAAKIIKWKPQYNLDKGLKETKEWFINIIKINEL